MSLTYTIHYVPNGHKCQSGTMPDAGLEQITEILQDFLRRSCPVTLRIHTSGETFVLHHNPDPITLEQALAAWSRWKWK